MDQNSSSSRKQIRNLLLVLGSSILFAFIVGTYFVIYHSPTGAYYARNILIDPEVLDQMNFNDSNSKTGGVSRFVFDRIEFKWIDSGTHQWKHLSIDPDQYAKVYQMLSSDKSILDPSLEVQELFVRTQPARVIISIRTDSKNEAQSFSKIFQEVQVSQDQDYYRVELHEQNDTERWVYYYHPQVFKKIFTTLVPSS